MHSSFAQDLQSQLIQTQTNQAELDKSAEKLTRLHEELNHQLDLTVVKQKELEKQQSENAVSSPDIILRLWFGQETLSDLYS